MAFEAPSSSRERTPPHREKTKRRRLQSPSTSSHENSNPSTQQWGATNEKSSSEPAISISGPRRKWADILAAVEQESMAFQINRYKEWRRTGSPHENYCVVCLQSSSSLEPCDTCRLGFHSDCMPQGWIRGSDQKWFCPICVYRNWHTSPPALTPPASPRSSSPQDSRQDRESTTARTIPPAQSLSHGIPTPQPNEDTLRESLTLPPIELGNSTIQTSPNLGTWQIQDVSSLPNRPLGETSHLTPPNDISSTPQKPQARGRPNRKSKFTTLSKEVDASLSVIYRELEAGLSLKTQVEDLQQENAKNLQIINIRDLTIKSLRRELERRRASEEEIERMKTSAAQFDRISAEVNELRAKNAALEAELKSAREETATVNESLNSWKERLAQLINP